MKKSIVSVLLCFAVIFSIFMTSCTQGAVDIDTENMLTVKMNDIGKETDSEKSQKPKYTEPDYKLSSEEEEIAKKAGEFMDQLDFSGSVLLGVGDHIIYRGSYGYADKKSKSENTDDSVYQIASLTKQFTAAAILLLQEQGKLKVTDSLEKYLPGYDHASELTIENLLFMASGLQDFAEAYILDSIDEDKDYPVGDIFKLVEGFNLWATPGTTYEYCNTNYYVLGMIIEKASGMTYEEYLSKYIFEPLHMDSTSLDNKTVTSKGYSWGNEFDCIYNKSVFFSAGAICSTTEDMFRWLRGFNGGKVVNEESLKYIRSDHNKLGYSCGWTVSDEGLQRHSGNLSGYKTFDMIEYGHGVKVVVLSNNEQQESRYIGTELVNIAIGCLE